MRCNLLITGGLVVDGTGAPAREADVAISGDVITAVGRGLERTFRATRTLDARGLVVAPGFIDVHTHYDHQVFWDPLLTSSSWHGVTTVVVGNCGFGIAPCRPGHREAAMRFLVLVEGMSLRAMRAGIPWTFESFPEYLDAVERAGSALNVAAFLGHSALRLYVMGDAASERAATADERAAMQAIVRQAVTAGAVGVSSSTADVHVGEEGRPAPSRLATMEELEGLASAMGSTGRGVFMIAKGSGTSLDDLERLARVSGRPIVWAALFHKTETAERTWQTLAWAERQVAAGLTIRPQVSCRPFIMDFSLRNPYPFEGLPSWRAVLERPPGARRDVYASPEFRHRLREDLTPGRRRFFHGRWEDVWVVTSGRPEYEGRSVAELARAADADPVDAFLDLALAEDLATEFTTALMNTDDDAVGRMLRHPLTLISLSDAGAHQTLMCDAGYSSTLLAKWVRERGVLSLEEAVRRLTSDPAELYGLHDRGRLVAGGHADLAVFDPRRITPLPNERAHDLPGGEPRLVSRCHGMRWVLVNGSIVVEEGAGVVPQGRWPGRLLRAGAPAAQ